MAWLAWLLHAALVAAMAPALAGLCARAAARWRGLDGPALDQPWHDLVRLWRKGATVPVGASFVFSGAPVVAVAAATVAALLVPSFTTGMAGAGAADLVVVAGLLALSRGVLVLAGWEAGSALTVHAAGRGTVARLGVAPVLLLVAFALLLVSGGTNLDAAVLAVRDGGAGTRLAGGLAGLALLALVLTEHSGIAAWSGRLRGLAVLAEQVRRGVGLSLAAAVGAPFGMAAVGAGPEAWGVGVACWLLKLGGLGLLAAAAGTPRAALPAAALLALMAAVVAGLQGAA